MSPQHGVAKVRPRNMKSGPMPGMSNLVPCCRISSRKTLQFRGATAFIVVFSFSVWDVAILHIVVPAVLCMCMKYTIFWPVSVEILVVLVALMFFDDESLTLFLRDLEVSVIVFVVCFVDAKNRTELGTDSAFSMYIFVAR